jgi:hypothetical protein
MIGFLEEDMRLPPEKHAAIFAIFSESGKKTSSCFSLLPQLHLKTKLGEVPKTLYFCDKTNILL